jgi:CheY-like chemotaxis protein
MASDILVVDDEPAVRDTIGQLLEGEGYRVRTASDGADALTQIEREAPALVLLDLLMPVMTGDQLLDRLRADGRRIPVVFISALSRAKEAAARYQVPFVAKPCDIEELLATVARVLQQRIA